MQHLWLSVIWLSSTLIGFKSSKLPFNVDEPTLKVELSQELLEISGLAWYKESLAGVEDESGIVYLMDPQSGKIKERIKFSLPGDFEALEVVGKQFYALTSSGTIFSFQENPLEPIVLSTPLSWKNDAEGLAYDDYNNRLLILCKENGSLESEIETKSIFAFNLETYELEAEPVVALSIEELQRHKSFNKYKPSGLAIDPLTCELYILSSVGKAIVVLNTDYTIKKVKKLPGKLYHQPEGIAFDPVGNLYICNEGSKSKKPNFYLITRD